MQPAADAAASATRYGGAEIRVAEEQRERGRQERLADLRRQFVRSWLDCWKSGNGPDADGDGVIWCHDCNDHDATINPAAQEICGNDVDENCNGRKDDCPAATP